MAKLVLFVRHGEYDDDFGDGNLTDYGNKSLQSLAKAMSDVIGGMSVVLLSSPAVRASESAAIIADHFGIPVERHEILWSDRSHRWNTSDAFDLIRSYDGTADVVIVVTHLEYIERLPAFYAEKVLGADVRCHEIPKGTAWLVDCEAKTARFFRPQS